MIARCKEAMKALIGKEFDGVQNGNEVSLIGKSLYNGVFMHDDKCTITKDKDTFILNADFFFPADKAPYYKALCTLFDNKAEDMYRFKQVRKTKKESIVRFFDKNHTYQMRYGNSISGIELKEVK